MKVILNIFNSSDKAVSLLQIFFDRLSNGIMLTNILFVNWFKQICWLKFISDLGILI